MSTYTENYDLVKAEDEECYDVAVFNENWDTLDAELAATASEVEGVSDKIGNPNDTGTETVFGKLNNGSSFIKSMQTIDFAVTTNGSASTKNIAVIDPDRCVVQMLLMTVQSGTDINYTLTKNSLSVSASHSNSSLTQNLRFQIIEFY